MKRILTTILMCYSIALSAQSTSKQLIADETWRKSTDKTVTIITSNETTRKRILDKGKFTRYSATQKKDRKGYYWEYSFSYKREDYVAIQNDL